MHLDFLLYFGLLLLGPVIISSILFILSGSLVDTIERDSRLSRRAKDIVQAGIYLDVIRNNYGNHHHRF